MCSRLLRLHIVDQLVEFGSDVAMIVNATVVMFLAILADHPGREHGPQLERKESTVL